tara:strand:+ start:157 stop:633 length:477 start_codon:yes stop_codon:yes gene_type:complete
MIPGWLSLVSPHGYTDLVTMPVPNVLATHGIVLASINSIPIEDRFIILLPFSVIHIRKDFCIDSFSLKFFLSTCLHGLWLVDPNVAKLYLSLIHTPLHYIKLEHKNKYLLGILGILFSFFLSNLPIEFNLNIDSFDRLWVSPIVSHIILNELNFTKNN